MKKIALIGSAALLVGVAFGFGTTPAKAVSATFTETSNGIVQAVNGGTVASDGESSFNPFSFIPGATSDGISLPTLVGAAGATPWTLSPGFSSWAACGPPGGVCSAASDFNTWVLPGPGVLPAGENGGEPPFESVGIWTNPTSLPAADLGVVTILDPSGTTVSDIITFANGPNGAVITFQSDPSLVPLPAGLPLFATGIGALGLLGWRRKRKAQAVA